LTVPNTDSEVAGILAGYKLPGKIPFGAELAPVMYRAEFRDGEWQSGSLVPFADVPVGRLATRVVSTEPQLATFRPLCRTATHASRSVGLVRGCIIDHRRGPCRVYP
jgi:hypothetical protein